jgi:hypothetical protein
MHPYLQVGDEGACAHVAAPHSCVCPGLLVVLGPGWPLFVCVFDGGLVGQLPPLLPPVRGITPGTKPLFGMVVDPASVRPADERLVVTAKLTTGRPPWWQPETSPLTRYTCLGSTPAAVGFVCVELQLYVCVCEW